MHRKTPCLALAVLLAVPGLARAASHPSLLFGAEDVQHLKAQAQSTHADIFAALKKGADGFLGTRVSSDGTVTWQGGRQFNLGDLRDVGTAMIVWSFVWQVDGSESYYQLAHTWLMNVSSWSTFDLDGTHDLAQAVILTGAAFAYDVLYPRLSDGERAQVRKAIAANAASLKAAGQSDAPRFNWWEREYLQNHNWIDHEAVGFAALALAGEADAGTTGSWLEYAVENAHHIAAATSGITDGSWHEGLGYLSYAYAWHLPFVTALKRAGNQDLTDVTLLRPTPSLVAHSQVPDAPGVGVLTWGDFYSFGFDLTELRYAASHYRDGVAQAAADRQAAAVPRVTYGPESAGQVYEFLFYDPSVPDADLHGQPLDWRGSDLEGVIFRSGWDKGATLFAMKSGTYGGRSVWERIKSGDPAIGRLNFGHDHPDDNGFYLYANGSWLAPEAEGYGAGYANFTDLHNSLMIDGQNQLGAGTFTKGDEAQSYDWFTKREGSIPLQGSSGHFAYAVGDGAHLYDPGLGLTRWDRHTLFLDRKWVVIRDVIESSKGHDYAWYCHFMEHANREGNWIHGHGENGQSLGVAVMSPADFGVDIFDQSPPQVSKLNPNGRVTAARVRPSSQQANVNFLTALVPVAESSWNARPKVTALTTGAPDRGLYLTDGSRVAAAVFARQAGDETQAGDYHLMGQAGVAEYEGGVPDRAVLVQGTLLEDKSRRLMQQGGPAASILEADGLASDTVTFSGDALGIASVYAPKASRVVWYGKSVSFSRQGDYVSVSQSPPLKGEQAAGNGSGAGLSLPAGGGCSAGSAGALSLLVPALFLAWRRRRSREVRA